MLGLAEKRIILPLEVKGVLSCVQLPAPEVSGSSLRLVLCQLALSKRFWVGWDSRMAEINCIQDSIKGSSIS